jgi:hypothetical protein
MRIAYVALSGRGLIDDCLSEVVAALEAEGVALAGTVRVLPVDHRAHPCDMDLRVLPDGPVHRISQPLGPLAKGCRLDGGAIETIAAEVEARLADADLLVVNKFGKQEALGRGLAPAIAMAMEKGISVLVGVNGLNLPEFLTFAAGLAKALDPEPETALAWVRAQRPVVADAGG